MAKQLVAIVGRPNVGKSTLFNRVAGRRSAIVSEIAGTQRDRVTTEAVWADHSFILVDTGGLDVFPETDLWDKVKGQIEVAIADADVIIMVTDAVAGVTAADRDVAQVLRIAAKPLVLAVNKADNEAREATAHEFYELGLGDPVPVSAFHNVGIDTIMSQVIAHFPDEDSFLEPEADIKLAIVGRTNVGKSMLLNTFTGQERAIVSDIPGTTRDALDSVIVHDGRDVLLIDTAGIRRSGKIGHGIEQFSVLRSIRAIDRADVAVLIMDATELATSQDTHIASYILDAYKGFVLVVNKWDLRKQAGMTEEEATRLVRSRFKFAQFAPICFVSALTGAGVVGLLDTSLDVQREWTKGVPRYDLRRTVMTAVSEHPPSMSGKHSLKIYSVAQDRTGPPSFTFYVNRADMVHFSYRRYLENALRRTYEFRGSPLKIRFKGRSRQ